MNTPHRRLPEPVQNQQAPLGESNYVTMPQPGFPPGQEPGQNRPATARSNDRIGDIMRRRREERGDDLQYIADTLYIRRVYLEALEKSQYDQLPADAYVIGFLRSYAGYLGLDSRDVINLYRAEMAGRRNKPTLSMPTPVTEGRTPSVMIMIAAAIVALLTYALWYGLSSSDRTSVSAPPPLPTTATAAPPAAPDTAQPATASVAATAPANSPATALAPTPAAVPSSTPASPAAVATQQPLLDTSKTAPPVTAAQTPDTSATAKSVQPVISTSPIPVGIPLAIPSSAATKSGLNAATASAANTKKQTLTDDASEKPAPAAKPAAPTVQVPDVGIAIRAEQSSWVLVTTRDGETIYDHVMKPGEVYTVPNEDDLLLSTGNAQGIVISDDGTDLPRFSPATSTRVFRNIPLDTQHLKAKALGHSDE